MQTTMHEHLENLGHELLLRSSCQSESLSLPPLYFYYLFVLPLHQSQH